MPLTSKDIAKFARSAVEAGARPAYEATPERLAKLARESALAARSYYDAAQDDVRQSGYRVTARVRDLLWAELERIALQAEDEAAREKQAARHKRVRAFFAQACHGAGAEPRRDARRLLEVEACACGCTVAELLGSQDLDFTAYLATRPHDNATDSAEPVSDEQPSDRLNRELCEHLQVLRCPFCGGAPRLVSHGGGTSGVTCSLCHAQAPTAGSDAAAAQAWNRRAPPIVQT